MQGGVGHYSGEVERSFEFFFAKKYRWNTAMYIGIMEGRTVATGYRSRFNVTGTDATYFFI